MFEVVESSFPVATSRMSLVSNLQMACHYLLIFEVPSLNKEVAIARVHPEFIIDHAL